MLVGREEERKILESLLHASEAQLAVVYGRRRVGKSFLIRESYKNHVVHFFEGLENQSTKKQIQNFLFQMRQQGLGNHSAHTWAEALSHLVPKRKSEKIVIVLDEFQWMANNRTELVSVFKMMWDQYFSKSKNIVIILCGSIASFMVKKVLKSKALYGRVHHSIHLKQFLLADSQRMLPQLNIQEVIKHHMLMGGIPMYLNLMKGSNSLSLGLEQLAFQKDGFFYQEFDRIFTSHFGSHTRYQSIVQCLHEHPMGLSRADISKFSGQESGGVLTEALYNLEIAGFIRSLDFSIGEKKKHQTLYLMSDYFLKFYLEFISPNKKKIENHQKNIFLKIAQTPAYFSYLGTCFEKICLEHSAILAELLGFSDVDYNVTPYYQSQKIPVQIDLLFDRADNVITLCEIKWREQTMGINLIKEVEKKVESLSKLYPRKTIQKVLITKSEPSKDLLGTGYFYKIIKAETLISSRKK